MLLSNRVQGIASVVVTLLLLAALIFGITSVIPVNSPTSVLLAKMASQKGSLSGLFKTLKPKVVAGALSSNRGQTSEMMKELDPKLVAAAINNNGKWIAELVSYLDPEATSSSLGENTGFVTELLSHVDPDVIAGVVNANGEFVKELAGKLDPKTVATNVVGNAGFANKVIRLIDPRVLANAINANESLLTGLVGGLSPDAVANAVNANPGRSLQTVDYIDAGVLASVINANGSFVSELLGELNPDLVARASNQNPRMTAELMNLLDPVVVADILNSSAGLSTGVPDRPSTELIKAISSAQSSTDKLMAKLSPASAGGLVNQLGGFATSFLNALDPTVIAGLLDNNVEVLVAASNNPDPGMIVKILENEQFSNGMISRINPAMIATAVNANNTMTVGMLAHLNPQVAAGIENADTDWLAAIQSAMSSDKTVAGIDASGGVLLNLVGELDPAAVAEAMNANPDSFSKMMEFLDPALIADIVYNNDEFVKELLKNLDTSELANAMNADPLATNKLVGELHKLNAEKVIADIVNADVNVVSDLMNKMDPRGTALVMNSPAGESFVTALLGQVNAPALADAINKNADFVKGMITNMATPGYIHWSSWASNGSEFTTRLIESLSPELVASVINNCPDKISDLIGEFASSDDRLKAIAGAINLNPSFLSNAMKYVNTADIIDLINTNPGMQRVVIQLIGKIGPGVLESAMSGSNIMGAMLDAYSAQGKGGINPDLVRQMLENDDVVSFLKSLSSNVGGQGTAEMLTQSNNFIGNLLDVTKSGLKPEILVKLIKAMQGTPTYAYGAMQLNADIVLLGDPVGKVTIATEGWSQFLDAQKSDKPTTPYGWDSASQSYAPW